MASKNGPAATIDDIRADLQKLREDVAQLAAQVEPLVSATGDEALGEVKERIRRLRTNVEEAVSEAGERSRDAVLEVTDNLGEALEESLRAHPLTTIALAVGLGFLFGTAWRR
jgi:ElaB/YqjD/DUF883 family membrane-anchored ribosome-binding protein